MALTLLAQQYLPISPRHLSLLTLDNAEGGPVAVVAAAAAFDPSHRVFLVEWDDPSEASSFRVSHVAVPGDGVTALCLLLSADGTVHCVAHARGEAHVFRRSRCEETGGAVYRRLPTPLADGGTWTAAARLPGGGRLVASAVENGAGGAGVALREVRLAGTRLSTQWSLPLPALADFPALRLCPIGMGGVLALCHHAVLEVDPRAPAASGVTHTWRWSPHDPLTALTVRDNTIAAGTEDGVVVLWDIRHNAGVEGGTAVDHSAPCGAPVTGLHMPHSAAMLSSHADGAVLAWTDRGAQTGEEFRFLPKPVEALPPVFVGTPGYVDMAAEDHLVVLADESGTLSIFAMS